MPNNALSTISKPQASSNDIARQYLVRFAEVCQREFTPSLAEIWSEQLRDLAPDLLQAACDRLMKTWTSGFLPTPGAVRAAVDHATQNATQQEAELAWQRVLDLRRLHWNPAMPDELTRQLARLPEQIRQAARAAGVFRDFESVKDLHVWAKQRFIESFVTQAELDQDQFLLPDGKIKGLFASVAATKSLPASDETHEEMRERGLAYAAQFKSSPAEMSRQRQVDLPRPRPCAQPTRSVEEQKRILRERGWLPKTEPQTAAISSIEKGGARA